jgi:hypothetical protein
MDDLLTQSNGFIDKNDNAMVEISFAFEKNDSSDL